MGWVGFSWGRSPRATTHIKADQSHAHTPHTTPPNKTGRRLPPPARRGRCCRCRCRWVPGGATAAADGHGHGHASWHGHAPWHGHGGGHGRGSGQRGPAAAGPAHAARRDGAEGVWGAVAVEGAADPRRQPLRAPGWVAARHVHRQGRGRPAAGAGGHAGDRADAGDLEGGGPGALAPALPDSVRGGPGRADRGGGGRQVHRPHQEARALLHHAPGVLRAGVRRALQPHLPGGAAQLHALPGGLLHRHLPPPGKKEAGAFGGLGGWGGLVD